MSRRQLLFIVLLNAFISLAIAVAVVWVAEQRRPDAEELAALYTPEPPVVLIVTPTPAAQSAQPAATAIPEQPVATATSPTQSGTPEVYVVQAGDSLLGIALKFGLTIDALMQANNLTNPDFVFVGQRLAIPGAGSSSANSSGGPAPATAPTPATDGLALRVEQPGNLAQEQVQVINDSDAALNLQGWTLGREGGPLYTFGNVPIFPGGSVRVHSGNGQANTINLYWGLAEPVWSPGATARLRNPEGTVVASVVVP
ncbi:MAG: LysM peptidoglycan-binding domain-containing protein [Chloroflexi bacterium]|nr:LysM peptidoglycan-binding domain-containing protein [Chloroflexota bacterium]